MRNLNVYMIIIQILLYIFISDKFFLGIYSIISVTVLWVLNYFLVIGTRPLTDVSIMNLFRINFKVVAYLSISAYLQEDILGESMNWLAPLAIATFICDVITSWDSNDFKTLYTWSTKRSKKP